MILKTKDNELIVQIKNCKKPKFGGRGRTWDTIKTVIINEEKTDLFCDTTWGCNVYFSNNHKWYSMSVFDAEKLRYGKEMLLLRKTRVN